MLLIGKPAPHFSANAVVNGTIVPDFSLDQFKGKKYVILFFYPKDFTFVCPTELIGFQEALGEFEKRDVAVVGCSTDSEFSHWAWINTPRSQGGIQGVTYPIVSDINKTISADYGVLPLSLVVGFILITQGTPMGFDGKMEVTTLEGVEQTISQGPAAAVVPIKQLGTNGGGYFGVNSSHPLENPTYLSNMVECWSILIIPMAMVLAFGFYLKRKKLGYSIYGVMLLAFLIGVCINVYQEMNGNPRIEEMGIVQESGAMEGKEIRLGSAATALWSVVTTVTSNGSVNGMHDSTMPLSGMIQMLNMQINTWFGGVGVGWMNYFAFMIIAVFISGLMVGRTPEFLCKKVEAREMKIASIVALLHPFVILVGTALACYLFVYAPSFVEGEGGWVNNPGFHGLSEFLYEYTSSAANNGSGFEGLADNTWFWNYSCGIVLILSRFIPIIGQVAIAGLLAGKKYIPETSGTLKTDSVTFSAMTFAVIFIVAALSFFPVHALSTIAEHLSL